MDATTTLYSKLYEKYNQLKRKKESEIEQLSHDQELKFINYVNVAEELVEHLRSENATLKLQITDLTHQHTSIRSSKESLCSEYQNLFTEEIQKNKELSEEIQRLQNLQRDGLCCNKESNNDTMQVDSPGPSQFDSRDTSGLLKKKPRLQHVVAQRDGANANQMQFSTPTELERDSSRGPPFADSENIPQAKHCTGNTATSGVYLNANGLFQQLMECLVGMKIAPVNETEGLGVSALHQSSGYSFILTWIGKTAEEQSDELFYHVLSLGTFERVAPEWMKEDLMFSTTMCPLFFKRLSRIIGLQY